MSAKKPNEEAPDRPRRDGLHEAFCQAVVRGVSQADAVRQVWPRAREWTQAAVAVRGSVLAKRHRARIEFLQGVVAERAVDETIADVKERKRILTELIRGKITDFTDENGRVVLSRESPNPHAIAGRTRRCDPETGEPVEETIKLRDPVAAIGELNKMEGAYPERGTGEGPVIVFNASPFGRDDDPATGKPRKGTGQEGGGQVRGSGFKVQGSGFRVQGTGKR